MRFGRLVVLYAAEPAYYGKQRVVMWKCRCDCGAQITVCAGALKSGNTKSCGCLIKDTAANTKVHDLTGRRFGRLTITGRAENSRGGKTQWHYLCDCGAVGVAAGTNLLRGVTTSCGCYRKGKTISRLTTHGESHTRLYRVWQGMRERCYNNQHISYPLYGARGIRVCDEWRESYDRFKEWADASGYQHNAKRGDCTLDRIDVNGDYSPDNCRWVDMKTQCQNMRNSKSIS